MEFTYIRNRIRSFTFASLADNLLHILKNQEREKTFHPFWHLLILLKWSLEFAEYRHPAKTAKVDDINKLLTMIGELEMSHDIFNLAKTKEPRKTFGILAYQQFFYQETAHYDSLSRQIVLFTQLKSRYDIDAAFISHTGISLIHLLKFFNVLRLFVLNDVSKDFPYNGYVRSELIDYTAELCGLEQSSRILELLSVSKRTINAALNEDKRQVKNYALQTFDISFFTRKPLLVYKDTCIVPHRHILNHTLNYFIYEFMKSKDDSFTTELGARMEKYMHLGLTELNINFKSENDLRKVLSKGHNVVDFVIDDNVLVEAKAIELKPHVSINPENHLLGRELRQTISKAYATQMLSVANALAPSKEHFGIIVTYKKMFIGNSLDLWERFLEEETKSVIGAKLHRLEALPIKNVFLIDLHTWDLLLQVLKDNSISLTDILKDIREADANPKTKKMYFAMHLDQYKVKKFTHEYLVQARELLMPE